MISLPSEEAESEMPLPPRVAGGFETELYRKIRRGETVPSGWNGTFQDLKKKGVVAGTAKNPIIIDPVYVTAEAETQQVVLPKRAFPPRKSGYAVGKNPQPPTDAPIPSSDEYPLPPLKITNRRPQRLLAEDEDTDPTGHDYEHDLSDGLSELEDGFLLGMPSYTVTAVRRRDLGNGSEPIDLGDRTLRRLMSERGIVGEMLRADLPYVMEHDPQLVRYLKDLMQNNVEGTSAWFASTVKRTAVFFKPVEEQYGGVSQDVRKGLHTVSAHPYGRDRLSAFLRAVNPGNGYLSIEQGINCLTEMAGRVEFVDATFSKYGIPARAHTT